MRERTTSSSPRATSSPSSPSESSSLTRPGRPVHRSGAAPHFLWCRTGPVAVRGREPQGVQEGYPFRTAGLPGRVSGGGPEDLGDWRPSPVLLAADPGAALLFGHAAPHAVGFARA